MIFKEIPIKITKKDDDLHELLFDYERDMSTWNKNI